MLSAENKAQIDLKSSKKFEIRKYRRIEPKKETQIRLFKKTWVSWAILAKTWGKSNAIKNTNTEQSERNQQVEKTTPTTMPLKSMLMVDSAVPLWIYSQNFKVKSKCCNSFLSITNMYTFCLLTFAAFRLNFNKIRGKCISGIDKYRWAHAYWVQCIFHGNSC